MAGRPAKEFTEEEQEMIMKLSELFASETEIAYVMGINRSTLRKHLHLMDTGKAKAKIKLRRAQMEKALEGNPTMLIWLGKQLLGQSDNPGDEDSNIILPWETE